MLFLRRAWFVLVTVPLMIVEFIFLSIIVFINEAPFGEFFNYIKEKWPKE